MILRKDESGKMLMVPLAGTFAGRDCFLVCPGPSLKDVKQADVDTLGAFVLGVNTSYPHIRPDVWVGLDVPDCYSGLLTQETFPKLHGSKFSDYLYEGQPLSSMPMTFFISGGVCVPEDMFTRRANTDEHCWNGNSYETALHMAIWLGASTIYLVGCDFGGASDYYDNRVLSDEQRKRNRNLYGVLVNKTRCIYEAGKRFGVEIVSCTPNSPLNKHVPYMPLAMAKGRAALNVKTSLERPTLDGQHAEWLRWAKKVDPGFGVLVGCDGAQEWLLPWWYENYHRHNDYRIGWIDYGLSPNMRAWCSARGVMIDCLDLARLPVFHRKPFALIRSVWGTTIFMEPDCEVRAPLAGLFDAIDRLTLTDDPYNPWCKKFLAVPLATGVVGYVHGDASIQQWGKRMLLQPGLRSDQEALNSLGADRSIPVPAIVDRKTWQWLRLDGEPDGNARIVHWTGPDGKQRIREMMNGNGKSRPAAVVGGAASVEGSPLVSVVMTVGPKADKEYAQDAIVSLCAQTHQNWEALVVWETEAHMTPQHSDARVHCERNTGHGYAAGFNQALALAKGKYIARLDADDLQSPRRLAEQVAFMETHPDIDICTCGAMELHGDQLVERPEVPMTPSYADGDFPLGKAWPATPTTFARKEAYTIVGPFHPEAPGAWDTEWAIRAIEAGMKWGHLPEALYVYRRHPGQDTANQTGTGQMGAYRKYVEDYQARKYQRVQAAAQREEASRGVPVA